MKIVSSPMEPGARDQRVSAAIGVFDGVHLGHQQVISRTLDQARRLEALPVVITFDRHPNAVVAPDRLPPMVFSTEQKLRAFERLGIELVLLIPFDRAFSQRTGEEFVRSLAGGFGSLRSLCVGDDFCFGRARSGNVGLLQRLGAELGFGVHPVSAVSLGSETVSSTRIRQAIASGQLDLADQLLGRAWGLSGRVQHGDAMGRRLGFPTANLDVEGRVLPPMGVYAVHVRTPDARIHRGVLNLGVRPTLGNPVATTQVEVHLLDFEADLYGAELEVTFVQRLRDEQRFPDLAALTAQIGRDIEHARSLFH